MVCFRRVSDSTSTTVRTVPTQQAYRSNIANVELESDNPPLFRPHDDDVMRNEVILLLQSFSDFYDISEPTTLLMRYNVTEPAVHSITSQRHDIPLNPCLYGTPLPPQILMRILPSSPSQI